MKEFSDQKLKRHNGHAFGALHLHAQANEWPRRSAVEKCDRMVALRRSHWPCRGIGLAASIVLLRMKGGSCAYA